jgi:hypothetical protein
MVFNSIKIIFMSNASRANMVNVFTALVAFFVLLQGLIPTMPITNPATIKIVSAVTMFLVSALTVWKQNLSIEIDNKSVKWTWIVAGIATLGLLNDLFDSVSIPGIWGQWIRFGITAITGFLNFISKIWWPTADTKSKL